MWVLGVKLGYSGKATSALSHRANHSHVGISVKVLMSLKMCVVRF